MQENSLFQPGKRDEALEWLVMGISGAARNCATVVKKINSLCQKPDNDSNPSDLIDQWATCLFTNQFHDFIDEWFSPSIISVENEEDLANEFFCCLVSLTPFFYENKSVISPDIVKPKKYIWTEDDYKRLKFKLIYKWFYGEWDNWDGETRLKHGYALESNIKKVTEAIEVSSKANNTLWNKQKKIDDIFFSNRLRSVVMKIMPLYKHQYQADLFLKYTDDFISRLPAAFKQFDDSFYEAGTYLNKYFRWSV